MVAKGGQGGGAPNTSHGCRGGRGSFGRGPKGGRGGGSGRGRNFQAGVFCQVCGIEGHPVYRCFKRFDRNFTGPPQKTAAAAITSSYGVNTNWYMDTGATDHITGELEKLTVRDKYTGNKHVHAANGAGMEINHVGHSVLHSQNNQIHLKNILHVPQANKNLISVKRLACDNNAFLEFHPNHFFVKEQGPRGSFSEADVKEDSIPSGCHQINKGLVSSSHLLRCGTLD
jgi:histone deacetylase 1/2